MMQSGDNGPLYRFRAFPFSGGLSFFFYVKFMKTDKLSQRITRHHFSHTAPISSFKFSTSLLCNGNLLGSGQFPLYGLGLHPHLSPCLCSNATLSGKSSTYTNKNIAELPSQKQSPIGLQLFILLPNTSYVPANMTL